MKTSTICLGFLLCISSVVLPSEEEERQFDLSALLGSSGLPGLTTLLGLQGGNSGALGSLLGAIGQGAGSSGKGKVGKGKGGKGTGSDLLGGLFGGKGGKEPFGGKGKGLESFFGKGRSLKLVELSENRGLLDGALSGLLGTVTDGIGAVTDGKGGKGKDGKGKDGKGKDGKGKDGKGKDGKGKDGKGKDGKGKGSESVGSSLLDTLSNNLLGQIIQAALNLLTGALGRSDVEPRIDLSSVAPLPNPLTDPLGFITNPMISAIITAMVGGDIAGMLKAQGDLAGYLITQFITNAITG